MRQPAFPYMLLIPFLATFTFFSYQAIDTFLMQGLSKNFFILILSGFLFSFTSGFMFLAFHDKYKREMHLISVCTNPSIGKVKIVALSSHNTGHSNPTFMTIDFEGHEHTFNNVGDELRFKYKQDDNIDILYNPLNKSEFVFT